MDLVLPVAFCPVAPSEVCLSFADRPVQRLSGDLNRVRVNSTLTDCMVLMFSSLLELASVPVANKNIIVIRILKVLIMVSESSSRAGPLFL